MLVVVSAGQCTDMRVDFETSFLRVSSSDGLDLISGVLSHPIIPEACVWDFDTSVGLLSIFLQKANLSLFAQPGDHSRTEWRKLFKSDSYEIRFDDASKDFSDLPEISRQQFEHSEALGLQSRLISHSDDLLRDGSKEADDVRRRARMERLSVLRGVSLLV